MSYKLDFNNLPSSKKKSSNNQKGRPLNFIKFTDNSKHIVRPIGSARCFWRFWYKPARRYVIAKVVVDDDGVVVEDNREELKEMLGCEPEQRFAINVIDRSDNEIKILQGPMSMAEDFAEVTQHTGNAPGGAKGGDWTIKSTGAGKSRRYHVNFTGPQPFSEEERARINNEDKTKNEWYILEQVYKPSDMDYVKKLVNGTTSNNDSSEDSDKVGVGVDEDDPTISF